MSAITDPALRPPFHLAMPVDDLCQVTSLELQRGPHQGAHLAVEGMPELRQPGPAADRDEHAVQPGVALDGLRHVTGLDRLNHGVELLAERR